MWCVIVSCIDAKWCFDCGLVCHGVLGVWSGVGGPVLVCCGSGSQWYGVEVVVVFSGFVMCRGVMSYQVVLYVVMVVVVV